MTLFPMFLKLTGRRCLVVGGGAIGESKIASLLEAGAETIVVAPEVTEKVKEWALAANIAWLARKFSPADLDGAFLVVVATSQSEVNDLVFREARQRGIICNVVDDPERCDFYYSAVVRRGRMQIAISTEGASPALARRLRQELEQQFSVYYGAWLEELAETRRRLISTHLDTNQRRRWLHGLASREAFEGFIKKEVAGEGSG